MTDIRGNHISELCIKRAGALNVDIYDFSRAKLPPLMQRLYDLNKKYWVLEERIDDDSGFTCGFYVPKIPAGKSKEDVCPPVHW